MADQKQWPSVGLAVSDNIQCTANISKFTNILTVCWLLTYNGFSEVAPQWALASYSCIIGQTEFFNARKEEIAWTLHVGSIQFNDSDAQRVAVDRIIAYPQVMVLIFFFFNTIANSKWFYRPNSNISCTLEMRFCWNYRNRLFSAVLCRRCACRQIPWHRHRTISSAKPPVGAFKFLVVSVGLTFFLNGIGANHIVK